MNNILVYTYTLNTHKGYKHNELYDNNCILYNFECQTPFKNICFSRSLYKYIYTFLFILNNKNFEYIIN